MGREATKAPRAGLRLAVSETMATIVPEAGPSRWRRATMKPSHDVRLTFVELEGLPASAEKLVVAGPRTSADGAERTLVQASLIDGITPPVQSKAARRR